MVKEPGLSLQLHYDRFERRSGLVRFLAPDTTSEAWADGEAVELGDAVESPYELVSLDSTGAVVARDATVRQGRASAAVRVTKEFRVGGDRRSPTLSLAVTVENRSKRTVAARLGIEWTLTMLGGGGNPSAWIEVGEERAGHDSRGGATAVEAFAQGNTWIGVEIATTVSEPADLWWAPVETISNSEAGFERVYQGAGLLLGWPLELTAGETRRFTVSHAVTTACDRAEDEVAAPAVAGVDGASVA
jgi:alpha-amylase